MSKSFISILGTNDYLECYHSFNGKKSDVPVKYVQEDMVKFFCQDFDDNDEIRIFLTDLARKTNWENDGFGKPNEGLKNRLAKLNLKSKIYDFSIPVGNNEEEIWEIFEIILNKFRNDENVIVDITHSFRFLPMLLTTLLNYAKYQKNIFVKGIYYAAFESLGSYNVAKDIPIEERIVPIFDLTSLSKLQDWTVASFDFIHNANVSTLRNLFNKEWSNNQNNYLPKKVVSDLDKLILNIATCRGKELIDTNFEEMKNNILALKSFTTLPKPLFYLIDELHKKIKNFNNNLLELSIAIAEWCFEHNYFQQLVTLLQEFTITLVLNKCNLDISDRELRTIASQAFKITAENISEENWLEPAKKYPDITKELINTEILNKLKDVFQTLLEIRNDINHGGFLKNARNVDRLKSRIQRTIDDYKDVLKFNL
jgi:CRISPR-associated Csx2 family protein